MKKRKRMTRGVKYASNEGKRRVKHGIEEGKEGKCRDKGV